MANIRSSAVQHLSHLPQKHQGMDGLHNELRPSVEIALISNDIRGVAAGKEHPYAGIELPDLAKRLLSAFLRHNQVHDDEPDLVPVRNELLYGILSVPGEDHLVAELPEDRFQEGTHGLFVFRHENGFAAASERLLSDSARIGRLFFLDDGEINPEGGPFTRLAVDIDEPVVLADDPVHDGHTETGPFSRLLGGEKGLEYPFAGLLVHPDAGVRYRNEGIQSGRCAAAGLAARRIQYYGNPAVSFAGRLLLPVKGLHTGRNPLQGADIDYLLRLPVPIVTERPENQQKTAQ